MNVRRSMKKLSLLLMLVIMIAANASLAAANDGETTEGLHISIPAISVQAPIVPVYIREFPNGDVTWDVSELRMTVGRFEGMPGIGQGGNTVLAGHSERARGEADIFYNLHRVASGDRIVITANGTEYHYAVASVFSVDPHDLSILYPTSSEQLTLITCDLSSFQEDGSYSRRVVVTAGRVE